MDNERVGLIVCMLMERRCIFYFAHSYINMLVIICCVLEWLRITEERKKRPMHLVPLLLFLIELHQALRYVLSFFFTLCLRYAFSSH